MTDGPDPVPGEARPVSGGALKLLAFWLFVSIPLAWGVWETAKRAMQLF